MRSFIKQKPAIWLAVVPVMVWASACSSESNESRALYEQQPSHAGAGGQDAAVAMAGGGSATGATSTNAPTGGTGAGGSTAGTGNASGGTTLTEPDPLPAFCAPCDSYVGMAASDSCGPAKKSFELGVEGAYYYGAAILQRSFDSCGDQVYCGQAALSVCADFNGSVPARQNGWSSDSTDIGDIYINVTRPTEGWAGKTVSLALRLDGTELNQLMVVQMVLGSSIVASKSIQPDSDGLSQWHLLSGTTDGSVDDTANRIGLKFRPEAGIDWQGKIYVDQIRW